MKKMVSRITFVLFLLAGCAQPSRFAPSYADAHVGTPDADKAVLVLYRKTVPPLIYTVTSQVNDKEFASLPNNAFSWSYLTPGDYEIKMKWPLLALTPGKTINLNIEAGKYYFVEFGGDTHIAGVGGVVYSTHDITLNNYEQGILAVQNCCKYVPSRL
ncbi:DUF2846 domain-containing protein [Aliiglaciecola sp. LCG003]|uniref:DUF2846 domain-containing protein n=1 Tax=Aliiglaciecola sp. LCG003 TaxID=3053655 RepID=UPI002572CA6F|nr:DUF2846 domain-containing protein [Aliiglaciecola sp. LCG003]WJG09427.1 DUF2846 domain-containing protein [Aliiglaciecola sp. LCG003]